MSLPHRIDGLVRRWRTAHFENRQLLNAFKLERSLLNARMADERLTAPRLGRRLAPTEPSDLSGVPTVDHEHPLG